MQTNKIGIWVKNNLFSLCCCAGLVLWWGACKLFTPTVPIMVNEYAPVYLPAVCTISLVLIAIPVLLLVCSREFRQWRWTDQIVLLGIALMLGALIHRPRVYLDVQIVFFLCTVIAFVFDRPLRWHRPPLFYYAFWLYFIWQTITISWTSNTSEAMVYFNRLVPLVSYSLAFLLIRIEERQYRLLVLMLWRVVCIGCLLTLGSGIYEALRMGVDLSTFTHFGKFYINQYTVYDLIFAWSGATHPTYNALWIIGGLVCSFYLMDKKYITSFEAAFSWLLVFATIYVSQSRVGLVLWCMVCAVGTLYLLRHHRRWLWTALGVMATAIIMIGITQIDTIRAFSADPNRDKLMSVTLDYLRADPWKGCGLGGMTFDYISSVVGYEFKSWWPQYDYIGMYPHNQFLGDWMQSGIVGLVLICVVMLTLLYESYRQRSFLAFVYCIAVFIVMQIEMPLHILSGSSIIAFMMCFFLCHRAPSERYSDK